MCTKRGISHSHYVLISSLALSAGRRGKGGGDITSQAAKSVTRAGVTTLDILKKTDYFSQEVRTPPSLMNKTIHLSQSMIFLHTLTKWVLCVNLTRA